MRVHEKAGDYLVAYKGTDVVITAVSENEELDIRIFKTSDGKRFIQEDDYIYELLDEVDDANDIELDDWNGFYYRTTGAPMNTL